MHAGLYRVMAQDGLELNTVNTKNGEQQVLNLKLVKYWTPEEKASPWHRMTLWGDQALRYVDHIDHNQAVYVEGDLEFDGYQMDVVVDGEERTINRITPSFRRVNEFRVVNVVSIPKPGDDSAMEEDAVTKKAKKAAKSKSTKSTDDQVPF